MSRSGEPDERILSESSTTVRRRIRLDRKHRLAERGCTSMNVTETTPARPIVLITGATNGLGHWLAVRLAELGAGVIIHGRDPDRLDATARAMQDEGGGRPHGTVLADLADLSQV